MRIAYSCAGEGYGHAARMTALYGDLAARHSVDLFVPDTVAGFVRNKLPGTPIRKIPCFTLSKRDNRVEYGKTFLDAVGVARRIPLEVRRLARLLERRNVDAVLSDFDPFLPWAARSAGIPVVQMNHPGVVLRYLRADPRSWLACFLAKFLEGPSDVRLIVSFFGGDVGPVLRKSLYRHPVRDEGFIAVNLKGDARERVLPVLDATTGLRYRLYPAPGADFDEGLASCSAVLTNAGHQTLSEALCLGKPTLALPQEGQYEQILNARMLERTGRGTWCKAKELPRVLPRFLERLDEYRLPRILPAGFDLDDSRDRLLEALETAFSRGLGGEFIQQAV